MSFTLARDPTARSSMPPPGVRPGAAIIALATDEPAVHHGWSELCSRGAAGPPLTHQLPAYSPLSLRALVTAAATAAWLPRITAALSADLRRTYLAEAVHLCASGTQALQLALDAACSRAGERVVALPAYGCYDLATAAVGADCRVMLYDLDPATLSPAEDSLERVLRAGAPVVVLALLYGVPLPWDRLAALTASNGAMVIEDAAQGHGALWQGQPPGSLAPASVLSFGRGKGWTGAGGGALLLRGGLEAQGLLPHAALVAEGAVILRAAAQWLLGRPSIYGLATAIPWLALGETLYHPPGQPTAAPRAALALLARNAELARREVSARRANVLIWKALLREAPDLTWIRPPRDSVAGWLRLPALLPRGLRSTADPAAAHRLGVASGYPAPLSRLAPLRARLTGPERAWPGAERLCHELITLPAHSRLRPADQQRVARLLNAPDRRASVHVAGALP